VGGAQRPEEERYLEALRARAEALGVLERVRFLGSRGDVPRLLAAADIFCQPNRAPEGFGLVFTEAMAAGLPVVTTAIGPALEIVVDTETGMLVPLGDRGRLAQALQALASDPAVRERQGQQGRARVCARFGTPQQVQALRAALSRAASAER
jgi:glycosyltransferase involved in cell wall biosynthesis